MSLLSAFLLSHGHLHGNLFVRLVAVDHKVVGGKVVNRVDLARNGQRWEGARFALQLHFERLHMILVHVGVAQDLPRACAIERKGRGVVMGQDGKQTAALATRTGG